MLTLHHLLKPSKRSSLKNEGWLFVFHYLVGEAAGLDEQSIVRTWNGHSARTISPSPECLWGVACCHERIYAANLHQQQQKKQPYQTCHKKNSKFYKQKAVWPPTTGMLHSLTLPPVVSHCCLWFQDYHGPPQCSSCHRALSPCVVLQIPCQ